MATWPTQVWLVTHLRGIPEARGSNPPIEILFLHHQTYDLSEATAEQHYLPRFTSLYLIGKSVRLQPSAIVSNPT